MYFLLAVFICKFDTLMYLVQLSEVFGQFIFSTTIYVEDIIYESAP